LQIGLCPLHHSCGAIHFTRASGSSNDEGSPFFWGAGIRDAEFAGRGPHALCYDPRALTAGLGEQHKESAFAQMCDGVNASDTVKQVLSHRANRVACGGFSMGGAELDEVSDVDTQDRERVAVLDGPLALYLQYPQSMLRVVESSLFIDQSQIREPDIGGL
jgi:hypothetical protein